MSFTFDILTSFNNKVVTKSMLAPEVAYVSMSDALDVDLSEQEDRLIVQQMLIKVSSHVDTKIPLPSRHCLMMSRWQMYSMALDQQQWLLIGRWVVVFSVAQLNIPLDLLIPI